MFQLAHLFDLTGRHALVTGGNSGIGLAIAQALGLAGASVVLVARRPQELQAAAAGLREQGICVNTIDADLSKPDGPNHVFTVATERGYQVDIVVSAAGINLRQPFQEVTVEGFDQHMAIHLRAPFRLTQLFAPGMAERRWGRIINLASLQSVRAFANSAPYGAAKGGVAQLTRATAEAWSQQGITCNAIAPGFFPTPLTAPVFGDPERAARNAAQTAIGRNGELTDLFGAAVFLASNASAYITGQILYVDGGYTAK
ncbi:SDR family NAD(P)-dependent oxidoreductase [Microvirga arabica]|uniref:SDR family NAD(P)-dependent oxidoreductase n=1 Tax=Microvirga arabica TaxID=1128671 RepID=UPI001939FF8B|nr:SDR family oxidoreductase [Microvirga arabica]MBM1173562.1 SDR family oxidoreductase [Microvirga arabica]